MSKLAIEPITPSIGAYVHVDAKQAAADGNPERILDALNQYNVLVFPQVNMSDEQFLALTHALGDMEKATVTADGSDTSDKGIYRITLDKDDKTLREYVKGNDYWHMDGTSYNIPGKGTLLKCENPPSEGGDTEFANLFAAYAALPADKKQAIEGKKVMHCMAAVGEKLYEQPTPEDYERWNAIFPETEQALVWHQKDGRTSLVIGSTACDIVGLPHEEGKDLLHELLEWCTQDQFTYRHQWQKGDLVIFNNPGLLHRSHPYDESANRLMHRTTLKGTEAIV